MIARCRPARRSSVAVLPKIRMNSPSITVSWSDDVVGALEVHLLQASRLDLLEASLDRAPEDHEVARSSPSGRSWPRARCHRRRRRRSAGPRRAVQVVGVEPLPGAAGVVGPPQRRMSRPRPRSRPPAAGRRRGAARGWRGTRRQPSPASIRRSPPSSRSSVEPQSTARRSPGSRAGPSRPWRRSCRRSRPCARPSGAWPGRLSSARPRSRGGGDAAAAVGADPDEPASGAESAGPRRPPCWSRWSAISRPCAEAPVQSPSRATLVTADRRSAGPVRWSSPPPRRADRRRRPSRR